MHTTHSGFESPDCVSQWTPLTWNNSSHVALYTVGARIFLDVYFVPRAWQNFERTKISVRSPIDNFDRCNIADRVIYRVQFINTFSM